MKLSASLVNFKKIHKNSNNQTIYYSQNCNNYNFIENLYKFILIKKNSFIFESVEKGVVRGRYTIMGFDPDKTFNIKKNKIVIDNFKKKIIVKKNILSYLNNLLKNFKVKSSGNLPRMSSMLVGYFSYDIIRLIEKIPDRCKNDIDIPDIRLMRPRKLIIYDNVKKKIFFIQNIFKDQNINNYEFEYEKIKNTFKEFQHYGAIKLPSNFHKNKKKIKVKSNISKSKFKNIVLKAKNYIKKGDIFQVVLSQRFEASIEKPPLEIYNTLRILNPSPFMFYFNYKDFQVLGSSPEILVRLVNGEVTVRPIAGSRPRGKNKKQDNKLTSELLKDPKELAEHLMLLDLGRNDVGKVSRIISVKVTEKFKVEIGYFTANQELDTCIALRTALIKNKKIYVQAGAGIVSDSNPKNEYNETVNKAKALFKAVN